MRGGKKNTYNGIDYRSVQESTFAKLLDKYKLKFLYEPYTFEVLPAFDFKGKKVRAITYTPDFLVDNKVIVEVKGWIGNNKDFPLRAKLFKRYLVEYNPEWDYIIVTNKKEMEEFVNGFVSKP